MAELEIKPSAAMRLRVAGLMLCALAITALLVGLLTDWGAGIFTRKTNLKTFMPDATGLEVGSPVPYGWNPDRKNQVDFDFGEARYPEGSPRGSAGGDEISS